MVERLEDSARDLGAWGPLIFGLVYVAAVVARVPASALTLAAGAVFGLAVGTVTASAGVDGRGGGLIPDLTVPGGAAW